MMLLIKLMVITLLFFSLWFLLLSLQLQNNSYLLSLITGRVRALEGEVNSLQTVITELEKTIAYQNKTAEDAKLQLEDEKWRLREHVQKLEDKVGTAAKNLRLLTRLSGHYKEQKKLILLIDRSISYKYI